MHAICCLLQSSVVLFSIAALGRAVKDVLDVPQQENLIGLASIIDDLQANRCAKRVVSIFVLPRESLYFTMLAAPASIPPQGKRGNGRLLPV